MMKGFGALSGVMLSAGIGSEIDPHASIINILAIVCGSAFLGMVFGAIADTFKR